MLKQENANLRGMLQQKEQELHNLETILSQERRKGYEQYQQILELEKVVSKTNDLHQSNQNSKTQTKELTLKVEQNNTSNMLGFEYQTIVNKRDNIEEKLRNIQSEMDQFCPKSNNSSVA